MKCPIYRFLPYHFLIINSVTMNALHGETELKGGCQRGRKWHHMTWFISQSSCLIKCRSSIRSMSHWSVESGCCREGWRSSCPRAGAKWVQLRDRALTTPLGVVVPGSRSIECIWGVWVWVPCPFLCVYMWGEGVYIHLRAWGWERLLVYMGACSSTSMYQVGP